jgi:uncharacterized membrane protein (UPF0136 family)
MVQVPAAAEESSASRVMRGSASATPLLDALLRALVVLAAIALLLSLWRQWAFDRSAEPDIALNAWAYFSGRDYLLAALALGAGAGAGAGTRRAGWGSLCASAIAFVLTAGMLVLSNLGAGVKYATLASALLLAASAARFAPPRFRAAPERWLLRVIPAPLRPGAAAEARIRATVRRALTSSAFLGAVIAVATFPLFSIGPALATDGAWQAALHLAAAKDLHFGSDIVFTYGPLGYLTLPMLYFAGTGTQAFLYVVLVQVVFAGVALGAARRAMPLRWALPFTFLLMEATRMSAFNELTSTVLVPGAALIVSVHLLSRWEREAIAPGLWTAAGFGALTALQLLIKLNSGIVVALCGALALVAIGGPRRWRRVGVFAGVLIAALLALWVGNGQRLDDIVPYFRYSYEIVMGFGQAMMADELLRQWEYVAAVILTLLALWTAWDYSRGWSRTTRAALLAILALFIFSWWKQGFVRHDGAHSPQFFISIAIAAVAFLTRLRPAPALAMLAVAIVAMLGAENPSPKKVVPVRASVKALWFDTKTMRDADAYILSTRAYYRGQSKMDAGTLALLRGRTTHIYPLDASVAWLYPEIDWRPLPTIQTYVAYTAALQKKDAELLRSDRAPERILRVPGFGSFDDAPAGLELFCHYTDLHTTADFEVLGRVPSRCGSPRRIASVRSTSASAPVDIPDPPSSREVVIARVHGLGISGWERPYSLGFRAYDRFVTLSRDTYRFLPGHGGLPALLKVPAALDYPGTWALNEPGSKISFTIRRDDPFNEDLSVTDLPYRIDYYAIPVAGSR